MKTTILISILTASIALVGCSTALAPAPVESSAATAASGATSASGAVTVKRYPMHGKILTVDVPAKTARIDAGPIGDWMGAMTMNYTAKDDSFAAVKAGDVIDCTVFVQGDDFWVGEIKPSK